MVPLGLTFLAAFPVIGVLNASHLVLTAIHAWAIGRVNPSIGRSSPKALLCYALTVILSTPIGIGATAMFASSPPRALLALALSLLAAYAVLAPLCWAVVGIAFRAHRRTR